MTNNNTLTKTAKRSFNFDWMPSFRIAIPALAHRSHVERNAKSINQRERDDLLKLFQSDLSDMTSLKSQKAQHNVIQLRPFRVAELIGLGRAA